MWYKNAGTTFFRFVTDHVFDRHTDRQNSSYRLAAAVTNKIMSILC